MTSNDEKPTEALDAIWEEIDDMERRGVVVWYLDAKNHRLYDVDWQFSWPMDLYDLEVMIEGYVRKRMPFYTK